MARLVTPLRTFQDQFTTLCKGEIGRQHIEGASGCRFSPYVISPQPTQTNVHKDQTITPGTPRPTLCDKCVSSLTSHSVMNIEVL